jgi:hypothetical protein
MITVPSLSSERAAQECPGQEQQVAICSGESVLGMVCNALDTSASYNVICWLQRGSNIAAVCPAPTSLHIAGSPFHRMPHGPLIYDGISA